MGFKEPRYTQTPNILFDEYMQDMGYAELKVVMAIIRETFGFHRSDCRLSVTKLQKMTGLSRQGVQDGGNEAIERGLIQKINDGGVTKWVALINKETMQDTSIPMQATGMTMQDTSTPSIKESSKEAPTGESSLSVYDLVALGYGHIRRIELGSVDGRYYTPLVRDYLTMVARETENHPKKPYVIGDGARLIKKTGMKGEFGVVAALFGTISFLEKDVLDKSWAGLGEPHNLIGWIEKKIENKTKDIERLGDAFTID